MLFASLLIIEMFSIRLSEAKENRKYISTDLTVRKLFYSSYCYGDVKATLSVHMAFHYGQNLEATKYTI